MIGIPSFAARKIALLVESLAVGISLRLFVRFALFPGLFI